MVTVSLININYLENPVGIQKIEQIGWKIESDKKNVFQTRYKIQIALDKDFEQCIYETNMINSEESAHISCDLLNAKLRSSQQYFIRVKAGTTKGETDWKTGTFVTALLTNQEWVAEFITVESDNDSKESKGTYIRKEFAVQKAVKAAYAYTTALGLYHFYLNGEKVGFDEFTPGWTSYNKHLLYQVYDIKDMLKQGGRHAGSRMV